MTHIITQITKRDSVQKFSKALLAALFMLPMVAVEAEAHDKHRGHGRHHGHGHHRSHDHGYSHYQPRPRPQPVCRTVAQQFEISRFFTYTEYGTACNEGGSWRVVSPTNYPHLSANLFFVEGGRLDFAGHVPPRREDMHKRHEYGGDRHEEMHGERDYGYRDEKNHKNNKNHHF